MSIYLSFKEIWRNKGRFLLFSMVIALITTLVLFIAGLAEGLATANREYLSKLDGELVVFQENVKLSTLTSRLNRTTLRQVERVPGVAAVGPVGLSNATLVFNDGREDIDISLIGVEPGKPGGAPALQGRGLRSIRADEAVIDGKMAKQAGISSSLRSSCRWKPGTGCDRRRLQDRRLTRWHTTFSSSSLTIQLLWRQ
jgi:putative ABC transport system permease protein